MDKTREGKSKLHSTVRIIFSIAKKPLKAWQICDRYMSLTGDRYSESSMTARLREMVDVSCNLSTYEYSIKER